MPSVVEVSFVAAPSATCLRRRLVQVGHTYIASEGSMRTRPFQEVALAPLVSQGNKYRSQLYKLYALRALSCVREWVAQASEQEKGGELWVHCTPLTI